MAMSAGKPYFLKIDASRRELKTRPDIQALMNQVSAYRLSYLARGNSPLNASSEVAPFVPSGGQALSIIKAPTLEGTELWIIPQSEVADLCAVSGMHQADIVATISASDAEVLLKQLQWSNETIRMSEDRDSFLIGSLA